MLRNKKFFTVSTIQRRKTMYRISKKNLFYYFIIYFPAMTPLRQSRQEKEFRNLSGKLKVMVRVLQEAIQQWFDYFHRPQVGWVALLRSPVAEVTDD
jgi:hypothetical protein